jgi:hypothetical protein
VAAPPAADDAELWQGRPFLARPTGRLVLLAGALVLACAGGLALLGAAVQRAGVRKPALGPGLSDEQRLIWRRVAAPYKGGYVVVAWWVDEGGWRMLGWQDRQPRWGTGLPRSVVGGRGAEVLDAPLVLELGDARARAREAAGSAKILATVVLDLASGGEPIDVEWYYHDGAGVERSWRAPTAELRRRVDEFLWRLQAEAHRL